MKGLLNYHFCVRILYFNFFNFEKYPTILDILENLNFVNLLNLVNIFMKFDNNFLNFKKSLIFIFILQFCENHEYHKIFKIKQ